MTAELPPSAISEGLAAAVALLTAQLTAADLGQAEICGDVPESVVLRTMTIFTAAVLIVTRTDEGVSLLRTVGELAARMIAEDQEGNSE